MVFSDRTESNVVQTTRHGRFRLFRSIGNEFIFLGGPEQSSLEAKNSSYFRGSVIAGGSINLRRFFYQMEGALGLGTQVVHDGKANTFNTANFRFAIGYKF